MPDPTTSSSLASSLPTSPVETLLGSYRDKVKKGPPTRGSSSSLGAMPATNLYAPESIARSDFDVGRSALSQTFQANWEDRSSRAGVSPTANLTDVYAGGGDWGIGGRFGLDVNTDRFKGGVDVGARVDSTGVDFNDLRARLGFRNVTAEVSLLGKVSDPDQFRGAVRFPFGKGEMAVSGSVPLNDRPGSEPRVGVTYERRF